MPLEILQLRVGWRHQPWPVHKRLLVVLPLFAAAFGIFALVAGVPVVDRARHVSVKSGRANATAESIPKVPVVARAWRENLPDVFLKPVPASIDDLKQFQRRTETLVKRVSAAVVAVEIGFGTGSGVVVSKEGLVLTVAHVCEEPFLDVAVRFPDGTTAKAKTLGTDHDMDAGLIRITDPGPWPHAEIGDLIQTRTGDWVLALGHPGGFDTNRTSVARLGRILGVREGLLQTDCTLIGGDSGGPLFDMHGRVIGIHSRISNSTTENFHVPISAYTSSWVRLARGESWGEEEPPPLSGIGVRCADRADGCRIERIEEDSAGEKANLKIGDIVESVDDHTVKDYISFLMQVARAGRGSGSEIILKIKRDNKERQVTVKFPTERPRRFRNP